MPAEGSAALVEELGFRHEQGDVRIILLLKLSFAVVDQPAPVAVIGPCVPQAAHHAERESRGDCGNDMQEQPHREEVRAEARHDRVLGFVWRLWRST